MSLRDTKIEELVDYLQGTCKSLNEGVIAIFGDDSDEGDLTTRDTAYIDQEIFQCETCGWWYETCDMGVEENCIDCIDASGACDEEE